MANAIKDQFDELEGDTWLSLGTAARQALAKLNPGISEVWVIILCGNDVGVIATMNDHDIARLFFPVKDVERALDEIRKDRMPKHPVS